MLALEGEIEIMTLLRLQIGIADEHIAHITHIEVHIHLLERGCTETAGIISAEGHPRELIHQGQTLNEGFLRRGGEIVVAHTAHDIQAVGDIPVKLRKAIDIVLRMTGIINKLIRGEIVVHIISTQNQTILTKGMMVEGMSHMLPIAVVVVVGAGAVGLEVGLVVLIKGIRQFEVAPCVPRVLALQTSTIGIEMVVVGIALAGAEEVAAAPYERQTVRSAPRQPFLDVIGLLSVETAQVGVIVEHRLIVWQSLGLL